MTAIRNAAASVQEANLCYHCGLPVAPGTRHQAVIGGMSRAMCCAGCEAVASAIVAAGLDDYYTRRDYYPQSPQEALPEIANHLKIFDRPEVQNRFVTQAGPHEREASLILEGITCPACIWLNESHLLRQPGVVTANINYTTNRARVRWDTRATSLSRLLAAISAIGYRAYPYDVQSMEAARKRESRNLLACFAIAGLGVMQVMMYALPRYIADDGTLDRALDSLMNWAALILTTPVVFYSSLPFMSGAWRDVRNRRVGMDVPVAAAIVIAFAASVLATVTGSGEVYFDSVAMFVFFLLGARYLELKARQKAVSHLETLSHAVPATASRLAGFPDSADAELVSAGSLVAGDYILIRPGETLAADGIIVQGDSEVDESLLTGESMPVKKLRGHSVAGGSVNRGNPLVVRVQHVGDQTILSAIVRLMERASLSRPRLQQFTDRIAARFVAMVLVLAAATAIWWFAHDPARVLPIVVSVLIVTCPCALSLATPMAMAVATSSAAKRGLLVTRSHALETLARATHFVVDKTGTLTIGKPTVRAVHPVNISREEALSLAAALEHGSEHPVAIALRETATTAMRCQQAENVPGSGIEGVVAGKTLRIGTEQFASELARDPDTRGVQAQVWLADRDRLLAGFDLDDRLRPDAAGFIAALRAQGAEITLLSGDREHVVRETATALGIPTWRATMSPQGKLEYVKALQAKGAVVAMIGDGVNDAPVLAQAQVAVALMSGAALAQGAADMVLLTGRLSDLARLIGFAHRTLRIVKQNLGWAIGYNVVAIPLAMAGCITPWMAAIGMSASSLLVVANALRLTHERRAHRMLLAGD